MGAEYCPYCAAERWAMIVALSRFGTFSGLQHRALRAVNGAGQAEPYPNTPTFTFHGSSYTSKYLTFTPVEMETNIPDTSTGGYTDAGDADQGARGAARPSTTPRRTSPSGSQGAIPFIYFGGKYMIIGASYDPTGARPG